MSIKKSSVFIISVMSEKFFVRIWIIFYTVRFIPSYIGQDICICFMHCTFNLMNQRRTYSLCLSICLGYWEKSIVHKLDFKHLKMFYTNPADKYWIESYWRVSLMRIGIYFLLEYITYHTRTLRRKDIVILLETTFKNCCTKQSITIF